MKALVSLSCIILIQAMMSSCSSLNSQKLHKGAMSDLVKAENLCSKISFKNLSVPRGIFDKRQLKAFVAAINNTGSFEGVKGWSNITPHSVDKKGLSLGLFNQSFGVGTLQPLIISAEKKLGEDFYNLFEKGQGRSLIEMAHIWAYRHKRGRFPAAVSKKKGGKPDAKLSGNDYSVKWATRTIYNRSGQLKKEWEKGLRKLSRHPYYMKLQFDEIVKIHKKTMAYMKKMNLETNRAYLVIFDTVVQNGAFYPSNIKAVKAISCSYFSSSNSCELKKLKKLISLRVRKVPRRWRRNVRRRKMAIINGQGYVHGRKRHIEREVCVALNDLAL